MTDLNNNTKQDCEKILVISPQSENQIVQLLTSMGNACVQAKDIKEAETVAKAEILTFVILHQTRDYDDYKQSLNLICAQPNLSKYNLAIINPNITDKEIAQNKTNSKVTLFKHPIDKIDFISKISTKIRLRRIKSDEQKFVVDVIQKNSQLVEVNNSFRNELNEAKKIQTAILPKQLPQVDKHQFGAIFIPLDIIGGDLYDIWQIDDEHFGMFLGDVTGHGLPAALIGAMAKMALKYANLKEPNEILRHMNENMVSAIPEGRFVAASVAVLNIKTSKLKIACGGQPQPIIWRAEKNEVEIVQIRGLAVGMLEEAQYKVFETELAKGDKLILSTDGVTETRNMDGEMIKIDRLAEFVSDAKGLHIQDSIKLIKDKQYAWANGRIIKDDITIIGVESL